MSKLRNLKFTDVQTSNMVYHGSGSSSNSGSGTFSGSGSCFGSCLGFGSAYDPNYNYGSWPDPFVGPLGDQYPWSNLSNDEREFVMEHPGVAIRFYDNSKIATKATLNMPGQHNGEADAIRHAYWCALNYKIDPALAMRYGNAHENHPISDKHPINQRQMDLHNNNVGYEIGREAIIYNWNNDRIFSEVMQAKNNGRLQLGLKF